MIERFMQMVTALFQPRKDAGVWLRYILPIFIAVAFCAGVIALAIWMSEMTQF